MTDEGEFCLCWYSHPGELGTASAACPEVLPQAGALSAVPVGAPHGWQPLGGGPTPHSSWPQSTATCAGHAHGCPQAPQTLACNAQTSFSSEHYVL